MCVCVYVCVQICKDMVELLRSKIDRLHTLNTGIFIYVCIYVCLCVCVLCVCNRPDACAQRRTIWFVLTLGKHDEEEEEEDEDEDERRTRRRTRRTKGEISTSSAGSAVATLESVHSIITDLNKRKDVRIFLYEVCYSRSTTATTPPQPCYSRSTTATTPTMPRKLYHPSRFCRSGTAPTP
jgi:hypothetical protein